MRKIKSQELSGWVCESFIAAGLPAVHACTVAEALVQTSLWGIDSHGVSRLPHYLSRIEKGSINAKPNIEFRASGAATGNVDGDHGLGMVICDFAMAQAITMAQSAGAGIVGIRNSSHCGAIGLYTRQAAREGCIGIAFTHSDSFVTPHGGTSAFFGTNPISIAIPSEDPERPLCVDMATSVVPWNRIMNARRDGVSVPDGWGSDRDGKSSTNPNEIVAVKPMAEHKGFALAFLIDMLCGPLNGMAFGPHITPMYDLLDQQRCLGSLMIAFDIRRFAGGGTLTAVVGEAIREVTSQTNEILSPGEPEYATAEIRGREGIPMEPALVEELDTWAAKLNINPLPSQTE